MFRPNSSSLIAKTVASNTYSSSSSTSGLTSLAQAYTYDLYSYSQPQGILPVLQNYQNSIMEGNMKRDLLIQKKAESNLDWLDRRIKEISVPISKL